MILQALAAYYDTLVSLGKIDRPGWGKSKVSFALCLSDSGELEQVLPLLTEQPRGNKMVMAPLELTVPAPIKRSSGIAANFLCDTSSYLLGVDRKGKPERALGCFAACRALHEKLLDGVNSSAARAVLNFFRSWQPQETETHPALAGSLEETLSGVNLVFRYQGAYAGDDPQIRAAWDRHFRSDSDGPEMVCLVTGEYGPVESVHPAIKNVAGAQSSGAALVSFNAPAFCSYGKEQSLNAPTSKQAAFAYTAALNHLLRNRDTVMRMGDDTVVFWAKNGGKGYQALFGGAFFGAPISYSASDLQKMVGSLCSGESVLYEEEKLDPSMDFYILGLSPNAARLSVRFFLHNSFGAFLRNVQEHQERLSIVRPSYDKFETLPLWRLLDETVNHNSRSKKPSSDMAGEVLRAVLNNARYPATLLNGVALRIRAEHEVTRGRAAILKAYYMKNTHPDVPMEEVLTVRLNPESTNVPYNLGRLFSVLEAIQSAANPGINATIKDKYFNSASSTPAHVFPVLLNLVQKHLKKLDKGLKIHYEKQLSDLLGKLGEEFPQHLSLPQQGSFQLGYYHQTQDRFGKKEENENV